VAALQAKTREADALASQTKVIISILLDDNFYSVLKSAGLLSFNSLLEIRHSTPIKGCS